MAMPSALKEFLGHLRQEKRWWLVPLVATVVLVFVLVLLARSTTTNPFEYPAF